ncbi:MAG: hypothetical protein MI724_18200 [Spirochaetales bacterium]|nr:hypothetical protein [Spirochaetales bacterium]
MSEEFHISVKPDWNEMVRVNEKIHGFLRSIYMPDHEVDTYTMVACELVENGIKYGDSGSSSRAEVELMLSIVGFSITVEVKNRIGDETRFHLRQLDRTLQWIRGFQDPFQAYVERVKEISREPTDQGMSGLGIVRIAYEARAAIDFIVDEDDTIRVSAVAKFSR